MSRICWRSHASSLGTTLCLPPPDRRIPTNGELRCRAAMVKTLKAFEEIASRLLKYKPLLENVSQLLLGGPRSGN